MATSMMSRPLILFLIIVSLLIMSSEARLFPKLSTMNSKKVSSELLLRDIINNARNSHHERSMLAGKLDRVSPAGPDPQHH
uniref:Uncharacterized protein n=1 Tax=Lotus japonicus TaxID=34305 RepID=I3SBK8_LOTJA|nr:unknown [Lotus japonicus]